jgi:hypothetical protein
MGDSEDFRDEEARYEAETDAQGEAYYDKIGREWARDNAEQLAKEAYEENYQQAIAKPAIRHNRAWLMGRAVRNLRS